MKAKQLQELKNALTDLRMRLLGKMEQTRKSNQDEEFTQLVSDVTDEATRSSSRQLILNLGEQELEQLKQVEQALERIDSGEYGMCLRCEESIPHARLKLVPFAQYCVSCLSEIEKEVNHNNSDTMSWT